MKIKISVLLISIVVISFASMTANASSNNPLTITFSTMPPSSIITFQTYQMNIHWANSNQKKLYEGYFIFTVKNSNHKIKTADITFNYKGVAIQPNLSGKSLTYLLPKATFVPLGHGSISVEVYYHKPGSYNWEIGIIKA